MNDPGLRRLSTWTMLLFALSITASPLLLGEIAGALGDQDATFAEHYASPGNRARDIAGSVALIVSGAALVVVTVAIRRSISATGAVAADVFAAAAVIAAALLIVAGSLLMTTPASMSFGRLFDDTAQFADGNVAVLPQAGTLLVLVAAYPLMALAIGAFAAASRTLQGWPRWHRTIGWCCAAVMPLAFFFLPLIALPIWAFATAFALWRAPSREVA